MKNRSVSVRKRIAAMALVLITVLGICAIAVPVEAEAASASTSASASSVRISTYNLYVVKSSTAKLKTSTHWWAGTYATLNKGAYLQVVGTSGNFYKVQMNNQVLYVKKNDVQRASSYSYATLYCTTKSAPLRKAPVESAGRVTTLAKGEVINVLGTLKNNQKNTWLVVSYGGKLCYMYAGNAKLASKITLRVSGNNTLEVGQSVRLQSTTSPSGLNVKWSTSSSSIATVDAYGRVKGINPGNVVITAKVGNVVTASFKVSVVFDLNVKTYRQTKNYTCSAAAALAVLQYKGKASGMGDVKLYASTDGYVYKIRNDLNSYLGANTYKYATFTSQAAYEKAIITSLKQDSPVIARVAFPKGYFNYKSSGHYTTIVGLYKDTNGRTWLKLVDSFAHNYASNSYTNASTGVVNIPLDVLYQYGTYSGRSAIYLIYNP